MAIHASENAETLGPWVRELVADIDSTAALTQSATLEARLAGSLARPRLLAFLLTAFAVTALLLAAAGVYGAVSHVVVRHTKSIGIRRTFGARGADILRGVLARETLAFGLGAGLGLLLAIWGSRLVETLLFGVSGVDAAAYVAAPILLGVSTALASAGPILRALRVDPAVALREE